MKAMLSRAREFVQNMGIKAKLLLLFVLVLVLPVSLLDAYYFSVAMRSARENAMAVLESGQQNVVQSILSKADSIEKLAEILALDTDIRNVFGLVYADETQRVVDYQLRTAGSVGNLLKYSPEVNAVYIYNDDLLLCEMADSFFSVQRERAPDVFARMHLDPPEGASHWVLSYKGPRNIVRPETSPESALSYQRIITSYAGRRCAVIEVVIARDRLLSAMLEQILPKGGSASLVDAQGKILYSTVSSLEHRTVQSIGLADFVQGARVERFANDAIQIVLPVGRMQVSLVTVVPLRSLYSGMYTSIWGVIALSLLAVLLCSVVFAAFVQRQLRAIPPMMQAMHQIRKGDFSTRVPAGAQDELGALSSDFNYMSEKLQGLMNEVYVAGQMEREAELHALESNINPHFLYNSLATITWMARARGNAEIVEITETLAKLYRMVLSGGRSLIPFADEMEIVRAYLKVQKIRFEDKFEVNIEVSQEALAFPIIKNIVQPLVENALEHGLSPKLGPGLLTIYARVLEDRLDICVLDNGVGMSEVRRSEVVKGIRNEGRHGHAIRNIRDRLNVFYEGKYEFSLHSEPDKGTSVQIVIPRPKPMWKGEETNAAPFDRGR